MISKDILKNARKIHIHTNRMVDDAFAGAYHSVFKGRGIEFEEVREYLPGDEVRDIDWNVTARMQRPYVKNFREERELTVMLLVDVSASQFFGSSHGRKKDLIAEIGGVLSFSAIKNNDKVGLILFSDVIEQYIPPKKGLKHVFRLIRELLVASPKSKKTDIAEAFYFLEKIQKKRGVSFLISDFIADIPKKKLALVAKHHELISICITDPREMEIPNVGLVQLRDLETGLKMLVDTSSKKERESFTKKANERIGGLKKLMDRVGAGFIDIKTSGDYASVIKKHFKTRQKL